MKLFKKTKSIKVKISLLVIVVCAGISILVLVGCNAVGAFVAIPADHYVNNSKEATIEYDHSRCGGCHEGLSGAFSINNMDSYTAHADAWVLYESGSADLDPEAISTIEANKDAMQKYFGADANTDCGACHETTMERSGVMTPEIKTDEFCAECHDQGSVIAATADWDATQGANPHESHVDETEELACNSCHQFHSLTDTLYCNECHVFEMAAGWIAPPLPEGTEG